MRNTIERKYKIVSIHEEDGNGMEFMVVAPVVVNTGDELNFRGNRLLVVDKVSNTLYVERKGCIINVK